MTRLTPEMIKDVPSHVPECDRNLHEVIGIGLKELACASLRIDKNIDVSHLTVGIIPVTSGEGITQGFCSSIAAIIGHLGMKGFVTTESDVAGLAEAVRKGADIVMMADDKEYIALNLKERKYADNTMSTALGYFMALKIALDGLKDKEVLLIGVGRIGLQVVNLLTNEEANITIVEKNEDRAAAVKKMFPNVNVERSLEKAVREAGAFINASPAQIPGEWIKVGACVSSPGMPYSFDEEGESRIGRLIHDPLQTGVAVMAIWSASYSLLDESERPNIIRCQMNP